MLFKGLKGHITKSYGLTRLLQGEMCRVNRGHLLFTITIHNNIIAIRLKGHLGVAVGHIRVGKGSVYKTLN